MSFTLEVRITGICLFVPQPKEEPPRVSVLMPVTHTHPHETALLYHKDFDGGACTTTVDDYCKHELSDRLLTLSDGSEPHVYVPGVYQLNRPGRNRKAPRNAGPAHNVKSKIILESGYCERVMPGARFLVDRTITRMPYEVWWVFPEMSDPTLKLYDLHSPGTLMETVPLSVPTGDRAVLYLRCVPSHELSPEYPHLVPNQPIDIHHFAELDKMLVPGHYPVDMPRWRKQPGDEPFTASLRPASHPAVGNPYTCMPGQTDPDGP